MTCQTNSDNCKADARHFLLPNAELSVWPNWLPAHQASALQARLTTELSWRQEQIRIYGKVVKIPRRQVWMGDAHCSYQYSGVRFAPELWHPLVQQLAAKLTDMLGHPFNCVLLNLYANGTEHMGWHADDEPELGRTPVIASLSLGASRRFDLKHRTDGHQLQLALANGSLLVMGGDCQQYWQHRLPKQSRVSAARLNLTFRYIVPPA